MWALQHPCTFLTMFRVLLSFSFRNCFCIIATFVSQLSHFGPKWPVRCNQELYICWTTTTTLNTSRCEAAVGRCRKCLMFIAGVITLPCEPHWYVYIFLCVCVCVLPKVWAKSISHWDLLCVHDIISTQIAPHPISPQDWKFLFVTIHIPQLQCWLINDVILESGCD